MKPINALLALDNCIEATIPNTDVICPACGTDYAVDERRQHAARCPVCCGVYGRAKSADEEVGALARGAADVETMRTLVKVLGSGFWRAEFRAALRMAERTNNPEGVE